MNRANSTMSEGQKKLLERSKARALTCLNEHEYSRAFAHFIVVLTVEDDLKGELLNAFLFTLEKLTGDLEDEGKFDDILACYGKAIEVLPYDSHVLHGLGSRLFRMGFIETAISYFQKSYKSNPFFTPSLYCMENLKNALVERWHFVMLNDKKRNLAYREAITRAVGAGYQDVLDIGAGTGILSMMAVDAGASNVSACEGSEIMFAVMQNVAELNQKSFKMFPHYSYDVCVYFDIPKKVSLLITELFDAGLFGEHILETLDHAWENFLVGGPSTNLNDFPQATKQGTSEEEVSTIPKGKVIPHSATLFAVPIECQRFRECMSLNERLVEALGLGECLILPANEEPYTCEKIEGIPGGYRMLGEPAVLLEVDFNSPTEIKALLEGKRAQSRFNCTAEGCVDGFAVWFELRLDDETTLSTAPDQESCWDQALFYAYPHLLSSPWVSAGDWVEGQFLCAGHLTLKAVSSSAKRESLPTQQRMSLDQPMVQHMNAYSHLMSLATRHVSAVDNPTVLDICDFPLLGLKLLRERGHPLTVLKSLYEEEIRYLQENVAFKSYEELYQEPSKFDLLIVDPVQTSGLLKKNLFEDVAMFRQQFLQDSGRITPGRIEIYAILIDSPSLVEQSSLVSDDKTLGYQISKIMNAYRCTIHQDINYATLRHTQLSEPIKLCDIDLNKKQESKTYFFGDLRGEQDVTITNSGNVSAILYWFSMEYAPHCIINTGQSESLFKQAACLLEEEFPVLGSGRVTLKWCCKGGCLQVSIQRPTTE